MKKVLPIIRVGIAVLSHPACTSQKGVISFHVPSENAVSTLTSRWEVDLQQWDRTMDGPKQIWSHCVHVAHQQTSLKIV